MPENEFPDRPRSIGERSYTTDCLLKRLLTASEAMSDEIIPYEELSALAGGDVQGAMRHHLWYARLILRRDHQANAEAVPNRGIRVLIQPPHQLGSTINELGKARAAARRTLEKARCVAVDGLNPQERIRYYAIYSAAGVVHEFAAPKAVRRMERKATERQAVLSFQETIRLFGGDVKPKKDTPEQGGEPEPT